MARFAGKIGFIITHEREDDPGVWVEEKIERIAYGDIIRNINRMEQGVSINDNIALNNEVRVVMDPFVSNNYQNIRYVVYRGVKWKVSSVDITNYPRISLYLGDPYNG